MASMNVRGAYVSSSSTSKSTNSPAYFEALPRSVSMSAIRLPSPLATRSAVTVLPLPDTPTSAMRRRD
jgi:hypothetical protein